MIEEIKSSKVRLHGAISSMQGGRPENQDDVGFSDTPLGFVLIVCDGMGGGPGGRTASGIVKRTFMETLSCCSIQTQREEAMKMAAARAQEALVDAMRVQPELTGMGSTFVAILVNEHSALIAHAGDSRAYRFHGSRMLFMSEDHSLVEELITRKALTREEARMSPQSNIITRGLGSMGNNIPQVDEVAFRIGDRFVLCTDGVWGILPHPELVKRLTRPMNETALVGSLSTEIDSIGNANGGGHDNHTMAVISMDCNSKKNDLSSLLQPKYLLIAGSALVVIAVIVVVICMLLRKNDNKPYPVGGVYNNVIQVDSKRQTHSNDVKPNYGSEERSAKIANDIIDRARRDSASRAGGDPKKKDSAAEKPEASKDSNQDKTGDKTTENAHVPQSPAAIINEMRLCLDSMLRMKNEDVDISIKNQEELYYNVLESIDLLDTLSSRKAHSEIRTFEKLLTMKANPANQKSTPLVSEIDTKGVPTSRARGQLNKTKEALDGVKRKLFSTE